MNYIICGCDRCGKDTQTNLLQQALNNKGNKTAVWHFEALKGFNTKESYIAASKDLYQRSIDIMNNAGDISIICNRFVYGEYVYGPLYRHYTENEANYPFELDKQLLNTCLIVLVDSSFRCYTEREDGQSLANNLELVRTEYNRFLEVYQKSNLKHKILIDIANKSIEEVQNIILEFTGLTQPKVNDSINIINRPKNDRLKIVVCKMGKSPHIFGEKSLTNESRLVGDWESKKLMLILAEIYPDAEIIFYGRCRWNDAQAKEYYGENVRYIKYEDNKFDESLYNVDQIHYIVGPHTVYNGVLNYINPKTNEPVSTLCMFKHYVGPLIDLINKNPQAKQFAYMSDRRYAINAYDMLYKPNKIYCQNITPIEHHTKTYQGDLTHTKDDTIIIEPFRFETLYLYKLDYNTFINNMSNFGSKDNKVLIIGNQVAPDKPAKRLSRYERINFFKKDLKSPCIIGKWTNKEIVDEWSQELKDNFYPNGLDELDYDNKCKNTRYSLILFNVNDGPEHFKDNWITVKYWESVYNGCLTFVEYYEHKNSFIPEELQVKDGKELQAKIDRCNSDPEYLFNLYKLQATLAKKEYFEKTYFEQLIKGE